MSSRVHVSLFALATSFAMAVSACAGAPPRSLGPDPDEKTACVGGLCVKPDHVIAYKTPGARARCLVVAWDGKDALPPTAKIATVDDAPAHPGVFAAIDMPSLVAGLSYPIASDLHTARPGSALVFSARVDPAVRFADQRVVDGGDVAVAQSDGGYHFVVTSRWADGQTETASFELPRAFNGCATPSDR